jgi:hypothetical protein
LLSMVLYVFNNFWLLFLSIFYQFLIEFSFFLNISIEFSKLLPFSKLFSLPEVLIHRSQKSFFERKFRRYLSNWEKNLSVTEELKTCLVIGKATWRERKTICEWRHTISYVRASSSSVIFPTRFLLFFRENSFRDHLPWYSFQFSVLIRTGKKSNFSCVSWKFSPILIFRCLLFMIKLLQLEWKIPATCHVTFDDVLIEQSETLVTCQW